MTFLGYQQYKDTRLGWPRQIPASWELTPVKRLARMIYGDALPSENRNEAGLVPVYGSNGAFAQHDVANTSAPVILIGRKGSCGALNWSKIPAFAIDTVYFVDDDHAICNLRWLYWALHFADLDTLSQDTGVPGLSREIAYQIRLPHPPLSEQVAIATFLDREISKIDALVAEQQRLIELLKEKRQSVLSHAVTKGLDPNAPMKDSGIKWLGEVPAHWECRNISSISTKITNGYVGPTRDILVDEGVRYLQSLHIKNNSVRFDSPYFVRHEWSLKHEKSILNAGDVLIVQTGDIGQVTVVTDEFAGCNCHALIIVAPMKQVVLGEWLSWILNSDYGRHSLLSIQTGALHPHLNCSNVKAVIVAVPPVEEQKEIVNALEFRLLEFDGLTSEAMKAIDLLQERRAALISAAVTGKFDVQEMTQVERAVA